MDVDEIGELAGEVASGASGVADRRVSVVPGLRRIGYVTGEVSATDAAAIHAALACAARSLGSADPRSEPQRRADLFADLLLGRARLVHTGTVETLPAQTVEGRTVPSETAGGATPMNGPTTNGLTNGATTNSANATRPTGAGDGGGLPEAGMGHWLQVELVDPDTGEVRIGWRRLNADGEPSGPVQDRPSPSRWPPRYTVRPARRGAAANRGGGAAREPHPIPMHRRMHRRTVADSTERGRSSRVLTRDTGDDRLNGRKTEGMRWPGTLAPIMADFVERRETTPAEAYERFRERQTGPQLAEFAAGYGFEFDHYQRAACDHLEGGAGVLVAAPTGAGKTIVGEFAVFLALREGRKCFYTTPIKALSNQKYADLVTRHGSASVGLLTGDTSINSEAPVVVMTTEVLRNMLYAGSPTLANLGYVVMDEVHYLADRFRGAVWEEVIIGLADSIQVVALSATVSNAEEFGEWLAEVRGAMRIVVSERRPVPLYQHVMVGTRLYDLFAGVAPTAISPDDPSGQVRPEVNPELIRISREESRHVRDDARRPRGRGGRGQRRVSYGSGSYGGAGRATANVSGHPRSLGAPSRVEMVEALDDAALLPAIVFIFSRIGCDAAVTQLLRSGIALTTEQEREEISTLLRRHVTTLTDADLRALNYGEFSESLVRGVAAHHAGMLPVFKECVEEAFVRGLVKVVFATETLALGINMPARSVVLEKLVKYNGETHADVTPGEYTQLTGRAGRRGIDVEGHAVVLWRPGLDPRALAGLASRRTYPLRSSFAPTYNMAVNLVGSVGRDRARTLLEQSFAQFQSDRSVVGLARSVAKNEQAIGEYWTAAACDRGDFGEYARLRAAIADAEAVQARSRQADRRAEAVGSLLTLRPGDIVRVPSGKSRGWALVLDPGTREASQTRGGDGPRPQVMTEDRHVRRLSLLDFPVPAVVVGRVKIPRHFEPREAASRRGLAAAFASKLKTLDSDALRGRPAPSDDADSTRIGELRARLRSHPCHRCPERETHARWAERALRLERDNAKAAARMASRTNSIAVHFDKICSVLESLGYLEGGVRVTESGRMLARIYAELDLVAAECLGAGLFDGLTHPQLAAVLAPFVYEARGGDGERRPRMPDAVTSEVMRQVRRIWHEVSLVERDNRLDRGPEPDMGFSEAAYAWAAGRPLAAVLATSGLTAGDFVRWVRQVIDFADQIAEAAGAGTLRDSARSLTRSMRRGVVDFTPDDSDEPMA